jgi:hypothetical protein
MLSALFVGVGLGVLAGRSLGSGASGSTSVANPVAAPDDTPDVRLLPDEDPKLAEKIEASLKAEAADAYAAWHACTRARLATCATEAAILLSENPESKLGCDDLLPPALALNCTEKVVLQRARGHADLTVCEKLRGSPAYQACRSSALEAHPVDADFGVACDTLTSPDDRRSCRLRVFTARAERTGSIGACTGATDRGVRMECVESLRGWITGQGDKGAAFCAVLGDEDHLRDRCLRYVLHDSALRSGDPAVCDAVREPDLRRDCLDVATEGRARQQANAAVCNEIAATARREACRAAVAAQMIETGSSPSACLSLAEGPIRTRCIDEAAHRLAVANRDPAGCLGIAEPRFRDYCTEEVRTILANAPKSPAPVPALAPDAPAPAVVHPPQRNEPSRPIEAAPLPSPASVSPATLPEGPAPTVDPALVPK